MSEDIKTTLDLKNAEEALGFEGDRLLREAGWKHTCNTPGSLWLWEKVMPDGRVLLVNKSTALWCLAEAEADAAAAEDDGSEEGE